MCGLCGMLGGEHWTEEAAGAGASAPRRAERLRRVGFANTVLVHYGLRLDDWQGSSYVLSSRTGRSEIVATLMDAWQAAERMLGRGCDPLEPALIERLEREA